MIDLRDYICGKDEYLQIGEEGSTHGGSSTRSGDLHREPLIGLRIENGSVRLTFLEGLFKSFGFSFTPSWSGRRGHKTIPLNGNRPPTNIALNHLIL
jgi:hypothetical protein